jgi:hypothetical protein
MSGISLELVNVIEEDAFKVLERAETCIKTQADFIERIQKENEAIKFRLQQIRWVLQSAHYSDDVRLDRVKSLLDAND